MKIDLNKPVLELDGTEAPNTTMGKILAQLLVSETKGDALKLWDWAQKLYKGEIIDLDKSDQETLKSLLKDTDRLPVITKAQILEVITK